MLTMELRTIFPGVSLVVPPSQVSVSGVMRCFGWRSRSVGEKHIKRKENADKNKLRKTRLAHVSNVFQR